MLGSAYNAMDAAAVAKIFVEYARSKESAFDEAIEPLGNGASQGIAPEEKVEDPDTVKESEIDAFYDGGWKKMSTQEQEAFKEKVRRCAQENKILFGE